MTIAHPSQCRFKTFYEEFFGWTPSAFTYILACEGTDLLKFGRSAAPEWRLVTMQTGCPFTLTIAWAWPEDVENELHKHFASRRVNGEWFRVPVDEAIWIAGKLTKIKSRRELQRPLSRSSNQERK